MKKLIFAASWRTNLTGLIAILATIGDALKLLLDGNPNTNPDWNLVVGAVTAGVGLMMARDDKVTSEQAGATDKPSYGYLGEKGK